MRSCPLRRKQRPCPQNAEVMVKKTHSPFALGDLTQLWAHRRGGLLLNASEIKLSRVLLFLTPPHHHPPYILSCYVGGMGRRERDERRWLVSMAASGSMGWGFRHGTEGPPGGGRRCCGLPGSLIAHPAKACYSLALIWVGKTGQCSLGRKPGKACPAPQHALSALSWVPASPRPFPVVFPSSCPGGWGTSGWSQLPRACPLVLQFLRLPHQNPSSPGRQGPEN